MKSREYEIIEKLNKAYNRKIESIEDTYSHYDAECNIGLYEIKYRRTYYKNKMLEAIKLFNNFHLAQTKGKQFFYVVHDEKGLWVCNISDWIDEILKLPFDTIKCPATTDFGRDDKFIKIVINLPEGMFDKIEEDDS